LKDNNLDSSLSQVSSNNHDDELIDEEILDKICSKFQLPCVPDKKSSLECGATAKQKHFSCLKSGVAHIFLEVKAKAQ
jgi:hypothetical protein